MSTDHLGAHSDLQFPHKSHAHVGTNVDTKPDCYNVSRIHMNWKLLFNLRPETYNLPPNSAQENFVSCHILVRTSLWSPQISAPRHSHAGGINMDPKAELLQREEDTHELGLRLQKPTLQLAERKGNLALTPRCRLILKPSSKFQTGNCHFDCEIHLLTLILVGSGA